MVRPHGLPKPVREHRSHESLSDKYRSRCAPGPGAYRIADCPKSRILGFFTKARRFHPHAIVPEDMRTDGERMNALDTPGPVYVVPSSINTHTGVSFTQSKRMPSASDDDPGPGSYTCELDWARGISIGAASRKKDRLAEGAPAPGTYNPTLPPTRIRSAHFGTSKRETEAKVPVAAHDDPPPLTSLTAADQWLKATRPPSVVDVAFPRSQRLRTSKPSNFVGPGAYEVDGADKARRLAAHSASFGQAKMRTSVRPENTAGFVLLPNPSLESGRLSQSKVSFTRSKYSRGIPNPADVTIPGPGAPPSLDPVTCMRGVSFARSGRMEQKYTDYEAAPGEYVFKTTVGEGPQIAFTRASRVGAMRTTLSQTPGPGVYTPRLPRRPDSAGGPSFTKGARLSSATEAESVPGPQYNPDYTVTRPRTAKDLRFPTSDRGVGQKVHHGMAPHPTSYTPSYSQVFRKGRSAILYFTG